jgi:hypothetical protein
MNSEIVGRPTDVPWGFVFVNNTEYLQIPRHPAQLYEAISCLFICLFLFWFWNRYKQNTPHGSLLGIFLIGVFRSAVFLRIPERRSGRVRENTGAEHGADSEHSSRSGRYLPADREFPKTPDTARFPKDSLKSSILTVI